MDALQIVNIARLGDCTGHAGTATNPASLHVCEYPRQACSGLPALQDSHLQADMLHACRDHGVWLAWLDAKMPVKQFERHHGSQRSRNVIGSLLSMFDLILPETDVVGHCSGIQIYVLPHACCCFCLFSCCAGIWYGTWLFVCVSCKRGVGIVLTASHPSCKATVSRTGVNPDATGSTY